MRTAALVTSGERLADHRTRRITVIATAQELGISIAAYSYVDTICSRNSYLHVVFPSSPLGRGFLTGTIQSPRDLSGQ